jgi:formate dehydrogenase major subunit
MSYERLEALGGIRWPCYDEDDPGATFLHGRLWEEDPARRGPAAPFSVVPFEPPVDEVTVDYPIRLTTGRRLDSYNTGVQSSQYVSPLRRRPESLLLSPEDGARFGLTEGEVVRVTSRRGSVDAPVTFDRSLRPGLAFMNLHFQDLVPTNVLTIDATDPKSGTAEFKATAIRIERIEAPDAAAAGGVGE